MIETEVANRLIEQIAQYTEYNVNIMDDKGVIVASKDPARIGRYHEIADKIVHSGTDIMEIEEDDAYPGVLSGINMVILMDGQRAGVVGVTGNPKEVKDVALVIKVAIEVMLKYENQIRLKSRRSQKSVFVDYLTHPSEGEFTNIRGMAAQLGYDEGIIRIPVLCCAMNGLPAQKLLEVIRSNSMHTSQDISFVEDETHVVIFKTVPQKDTETNLLSDYKFLIGEYLGPALRWLLENEKTAYFYVGSFQHAFSQYGHGYRHCLWLERRTNRAKKAEFFYDHTAEYISELVPEQEMHRMFHVLEDSLTEEFKSLFVQIMEQLIDTNYNMSEAAKLLYVHKNTLAYRYNKIKETLNMDPLTQVGDRLFLQSFFLYLQKKY